MTRTSTVTQLEPPQRLRIDRLVAGGDGLGLLEDGRVCFVPRSFPGDVVEVRQVTLRARHADAKDWILLQPSSSRVQATCPQAQRCGGCNWMSLETSAQQAGKVALVGEALRRTGGLQLAEPIPLTPSPQQLKYRSRIRLHVADGKLGLHPPGSHEIVDASDCRVVTDELREALQELYAFALEHPEALSGIREIEIRAQSKQRSLLLIPQTPSAKKRGKGRRRRRAPKGGDTESRTEQDIWAKHLSSFAIQLGSILPPTDGTMRLPLNASCSLRVGPASFTQVNWDVNQALIQSLAEGCRRRGIQTFLDLYCGAGNFSLPLLKLGLEGIGVESNAQSVACAQASAEEQNLQATFRAGDVPQIARTLLEQGQRAELVICDPPRTGMKRAVNSLARLAQKWIFLCSCDPVTFARDLKSLLELGFQVDELRAFDMFPQTHHVEVTAWLKR